MGRIIGIRHRVKKTAAGEARPTLVAIKNPLYDELELYELEDETAELDFLLGRFPISWKPVLNAEDLKKIQPHQMKKRKKKGTDKEIVSIPSEFDGLKEGDSVAMILGGSGDRFAAALSRRGEEVNARVYRIPPSVFKAYRQSDSKDDDHILLTKCFEARIDFFQEVTPKDRDLIRVKEAYAARREALLARMGCAQRLRQRFIGSISLSEEGRYPEGNLEDEFDRRRASDPILKVLLEEEKKAEAELRKAMDRIDVWHMVLSNVKGCGEVIAAGIVTPITDIRRFATDAKLKAFCGVHVLSDGRFARKRGGQVANWSPVARQALYLLGDQFNRQKDSEWGLKLREYKKKLREKHPTVIEEKVKREGREVTVKRYTDGHIHKMAMWRTLTKFVEWLWREWTRLEAKTPVPAPVS